MKLLSLLLPATSLFAVSASGTSDVKVDRLVSRRLQKRDVQDNYNISIFHVNDVHAHLEEYKPAGTNCTDPSVGCVGGYSRVKSKIDELRPTRQNSLLLNLGDEFQGTLYFQYYGGEKIGEAINQLGFDAMVFGNHEFDRGDDYLAEFLNNLTFPIVCANIVTDNAALNKTINPYHIFPQHQLAVIGVTTDTIPSISQPGNGTTFTDPIETMQATIDRIRAETNITRIIAMTHIGYEVDKEMAQKTRGLHLIVGGHSHTPLGDFEGAQGPYPTIETNLDGEEVFVVTAYRWAEYLGVLEVSYDSEGRIVSYEGEPIHMTNTTKQDAQLEAQIKEWAYPFEEYAATVVGSTSVDLDQTLCQRQECTLGNVIADAFLWYRNHSANASIVNAGGIRASIEQGNITMGDVLTSLPFQNSATELTFSGADLWKSFEGIVSKVNQWNGESVTSFAQVSGLQVIYNPNNTAGSQLTSLSINGQSITSTDQTNYTIVSLDFLAGGGDNFWPKQSGYEVLNTQEEVLIDYLGSASPVNASIEGRIVARSSSP